MRTIRHLIIVATIALGAVACALPSDENPRKITDPAALEIASPVETTTTTAVLGIPRERSAWFFDQDNILSPETRALPIEATISDVLNLLSEPPATTRWRTAVPSGVEVASATVEGGVLRVVFTDDTLFGVGGSELSRAVAQLVVTALDVDGHSAESVRFFVGSLDDPRSVPAGPASEDESQPVDACDYAQFLAPGACTGIG